MLIIIINYNNCYKLLKFPVHQVLCCMLFSYQCPFNLQTFSLIVFLLYILDDQGSFDPDEPAIVQHMICTSPAAVRFVF